MQGTNCLVQVTCNATLQAFGGDLYVGIMTVTNSVREVFSLPVMSITSGAQPVISYNYGAKQYERARSGIRFNTFIGTGYTMIAWLLVVIFPGFWAARISEITEEDTVLIIGAGPTGLCTLMCVLLKNPKRIIVCEKDPARIAFVHKHYPKVLTCAPVDCKTFTLANSDHGGADVVLEVAGAKDTFRLAYSRYT